MVGTQNILELAKQGNPKAIASLITRHLQSKGISAKAILKDSCLRITLESEQVPSQRATVQFIHRGMTKLQVESIKTVKIYGKKLGQDLPAWSEELNLESQETVDSLNSKSAFNKPKLEAIAIATSSIQPIQSQTKIPRITAISKRISQVLTGCLWLKIGFESLFLLYSFVWASYYYFFTVVQTVDSTSFLANLVYNLMGVIELLWNPLEIITHWISLIVLLITLVWLYCWHAHLKASDRNYPIAPWGAIVRFIIPFYSLWGIWNIFATLAKQLKSLGGTLASKGAFLLKLLPCFYLSFIGTNFLTRFYWIQLRTAGEESFSPWFFVAKNAATLLMAIIWLLLVRTVSPVLSVQLSSNSLSVSTAKDKVKMLPNNSDKQFSFKAIVYGILVDWIGTAIAACLLGFIVGFTLAIRGTKPEQIVQAFYQSTPLLIISLFIGIFFTMLGGFVTAKVANKSKIKHALVMGVVVTLSGLLFVKFTSQYPVWYNAIAFGLTIPAATAGGYLRLIFPSRT